jgi:16S rRNA (uracil1498-N3)-methyltransferase
MISCAGLRGAEELRHFFVDEISAVDNTVVIAGPEARHILRVLRLGRGNHLVLIDRTGARFQAVIVGTDRKQVTVRIERALPTPPPSPVRIVLCQSLLKSHPMDYLIQKTSELGVDTLIPFISGRTVVRLPPERAADRLRHWREVASNATKQSGRDRTLVIQPPVALPELIEAVRRDAALKVVFWEEEGSTDLKRLLGESPQRQAFVGMVGPEGGFTEEEVVAAKEVGFIPASLGYRILRSETAATAVAAIVQYAWGDLGRCD